MKKNIYLIVLSIVTVICIVGGSIYHSTHWSGFHNHRWFFSKFMSKSSYDRVNNSIKLDKFDSIQIDSSVLDITIQADDNWSLEYDCVEPSVPDVQVKGNTLTVTQHDDTSFGKNNYCKITIPAETKLKNININSDVGNIHIESSMFEQTDMTTNTGNITVNNSDFGTGAGTIGVDVGNINLTTCTFTELKITDDAGNINLKQCPVLSEYTVALFADLGNIIVNGEKYKEEFFQNGSNPSGGKKLTIENDCGNIEVSEK